MKINWKGAVFILVVIVLWQLIAGSGAFNETLFPGPIKVLQAGTVLVGSGQLIADTVTSSWRMLIGLGLGAGFGILSGLVMGRMLVLEETTGLFLNIIRAIPPVAIIPLMIVWFGIGDLAKILVIAIAVFFPVWISVLIGAKSVHSEYLKTAKIFSKSPVETFSKVVMPATIPFIITGVRIGIAMAFIMVFVSELAGASSGLGYLIAYAQIIYRIDNMIVGLIALGLLAAATDFLFVVFSQKAFPWVRENVQ